MSDDQKAKVLAFMNGGGIRTDFLIHAVSVYSGFILKEPERCKEAMDGGLLSADDWLDCAASFLSEVAIENTNNN